MKSFLMLVLLCLASVLQAAERPQPEFTMRVPGELEIGPDGAVRSWKMDSHELGATVEDLLQKNIAQWRFEPVLKDGQPVIARTRMTVHLEAAPHGEGYLFKVGEVYFGAMESRGDRVAPRYPRDLVRNELGARVLLQIKVDAQGNVEAVHPMQTSLSRAASDEQSRRWRKRFEQASIRAVSQWKFEPGESVGGVPVSSTMVVPVFYEIESNRGPRGNANRWLGYVPGPITPAPWADEKRLAQLDAKGLGDGEAASLDSRFKLVSDVVGKAL
jgi:TonB family protein